MLVLAFAVAGTGILLVAVLHEDLRSVWASFHRGWGGGGTLGGGEGSSTFSPIPGESSLRRLSQVLRRAL